MLPYNATIVSLGPNLELFERRNALASVDMLSPMIQLRTYVRRILVLV